MIEHESVESTGLMTYLEAVEKEGHINLEIMTDSNKLIDEVKEGTFDSGVIIAKDNAIEILNNSNRTLQGNVINQIIESYENYISMEKIKGSSELEMITNVNAIIPHKVVFEGRTPSAVDYYAVTMIAMYMFFGAGYGAVALGNDYFAVRGERVRSTTVKFHEHFIGLALGNIVTLVLQGLSVVVFTTFAFGANFGDNPLFIVFAITTFAVLSTGIGMFITVLVKDGNKGSTVINTLVPLFTLAAGGFAKIGNEGILAVIQKIAPNYHFHEILLNNAFKTSPEVVVSSIIMLWVMIAVTFIGTLALKGRRA